MVRERGMGPGGTGDRLSGLDVQSLPLLLRMVDNPSLEFLPHQLVSGGAVISQTAEIGEKPL